MNFCKRSYQPILRYLYTEVRKRPGEISLHKHFNDLPVHVSSSNIDLYADDTTISSSADCKNIATLQDSLNRCVVKVVDWANANKLPLNQKKTKALLVRENGFLVRWKMYR